MQNINFHYPPRYVGPEILWKAQDKTNIDENIEVLEIQLKHKLKSKLLNLSSIDEEIDNLNQKTDHATTVLYGLESYDDVVAS